MKLSVFILSATAATKVKPTFSNPSILIVLTKVSHRATRSTADLFKERLAELVADDERWFISSAGSFPSFGPEIGEIVSKAQLLAADATAMKTATTFSEWDYLFTEIYNSLDLSKLFQYGCWGQYQPDIPGQLFYL